MAKRTGLGRGLSALLGDNGEEQVTSTEEKVVRISIDSIDPNPEQPRRRFDAEALAALADSIRAVGVLQPILVCKNEDRYTIIAGERRWRAARLADVREIPAIVREMETVTRMEAALIENLQRSDLNPVEEAEAIRELMEECGATQEAVAKRLGKSRPAVANLLRLLTLPEGIREMLVDGRLTGGHARALVTLPTEQDQIRMANLIVAQGWSVRQTEEICARQQGREKPAKKAAVPHEITLLEQMARRVFGTKAKIEGDIDSGKLTLRYYNREDLQRIWDALQSVLLED